MKGASGFRSLFERISSRLSTRVTKQAEQSSPRKTRNSKPFKDLPEPKSHFLLGTALDYSPAKNFDPCYLGSHWVKRHRQLGSIYKENVIPGLTENIVFCSSPADTEKLFREEEACPFRDPLGPLSKVRKQLGVANGLTNSNGSEWKQIRHVINPLLLNNSNVWKYTESHYDVAMDFVDFIQQNLDEKREVPNFGKALGRWAFEGAGLIVFGRRLGAFDGARDPRLEKILRDNGDIVEGLGRMLYSLPLWRFYNTKDLRSLKKAHLDHLKATEAQINMFYNEVDKAGPRDGGVVLNGVWTSNQLTQRMKLTVLTEFLTAGIDTTSNCAAFFLYALAMNQDKQEIVRRELTDAIKKHGVDGKVISQLPYLNAFTKEVQRLFPFVSSFIRRFSKDITLSGYKIPPGTHIVNTSNMVNNRNPHYFDNPNKFLPERWLSEKTPTERQSTRFVMSGPFGMGARMCPGRKLAMQEVHLLLAVILTRYRVEYKHKPMRVKFRLVSFPSEEPQFRFSPL